MRKVVVDTARLTTNEVGCTLSFASAPWLNLVVREVSDDHECDWFECDDEVWRAYAQDPGVYNIRVEMEVTIH